MKNDKSQCDKKSKSGCGGDPDKCQCGNRPQAPKSKS